MRPPPATLETALKRVVELQGQRNATHLQEISPTPLTHNAGVDGSSASSSDDDDQAPVDDETHELASVQVYLRVRAHPEAKAERTLAVSELGSGKIQVDLGERDSAKTFKFDRGGGEGTSQEEVFSCVGRPVCEAVMAGFNGTIFAYGQTGAGKTYTLSGPPSDGMDQTPEFHYESRGLAPRVLEEIFRKMARRPRGAFFRCSCSYLQIYNDQITDLLVDRSFGTATPPNLRIRESPEKGTFVEGAKDVPLRSVDQALRVLTKGASRRHVAATLMNATSSRSHAIFLIRVHQVTSTQAGRGAKEHVRTSHLSLVDLAGSERQQSSTSPVDHASNERQATDMCAKLQVMVSSDDEEDGPTRPPPPRSSPRRASLAAVSGKHWQELRAAHALCSTSAFDGQTTPSSSSRPPSCQPSPASMRNPDLRSASAPGARARLQEACSINRSLSALSGVIIALNADRAHIPYRDSKLTLLLRDSIGGSARTWMLANVSPLDGWQSETLSTLLFASRAQCVRNRVRRQAFRLVEPLPGEGITSVIEDPKPPIDPPVDFACQTDVSDEKLEASTRQMVLQKALADVEAEARDALGVAQAEIEAVRAQAATAISRTTQSEAAVVALEKGLEAAMDEVQEAHTGKANAIQEAHDASAAEREARRQAQIEHLACNGELRARKINLGKAWQRWQADNATRAQVARMSHIAARVLAWGRRASSFAQWRHQWAMACTEIKQQEAASRLADEVATRAKTEAEHADALETERANLREMEAKHADALETERAKLRAAALEQDLSTQEAARRLADEVATRVKTEAEHADALETERANLREMEAKHADARETERAKLREMEAKHADALETERANLRAAALEQDLSTQEAARRLADEVATRAKTEAQHADALETERTKLREMEAEHADALETERTKLREMEAKHADALETERTKLRAAALEQDLTTQDLEASEKRLVLLERELGLIERTDGWRSRRDQVLRVWVHWRQVWAAEKVAQQNRKLRADHVAAQSEAMAEVTRLTMELAQARSKLQSSEGNTMEQQHALGQKEDALRQSAAEMAALSCQMDSATERAEAATEHARAAARAADGLAQVVDSATAKADAATRAAKEAYEDARLSHAERAMKRLQQRGQGQANNMSAPTRVEDRLGRPANPMSGAQAMAAKLAQARARGMSH